MADGDTNALGMTAPRMAVSMDNREFDPAWDTWTLSKEVTIDLDEVISLLAWPVQESYREVMKYHAENYSSYYCQNIHRGVRKFLKDMDAEEFSATALRNYRKGLSRDEEYRLGTTRAFLLRWHDQGYPGVSDETFEWLGSVRLKGNEKGRAILSMDPRDGPFDDQELAAILTAAPQEYERGRIELATLACTLLLSYTGRRPMQLSLLRIGDFSQTMTGDGRRIDVVHIPRAKQRGQAPRAELKHFWLAPDVYRLLKTQRDAVIEQAEARLGKLPGSLTEELPLFPNWNKFGEVRSVEQLRHALRNDALHVPTKDIQKDLKKIRVVSARTGRRLHITPQRFRYTLGTRAAREGYGAMVIAELLDHSDMQNAWIYTRDHPNFRQKIDEAVGQQLAPLARAFAGRAVDRESDARHGNDPGMRIGTREQKVGTCGSRGFCGAEALACYTCMHFQAWVDAPHQEMLDWMLERRQQMEDAGTNERVVSAIDPSILGARAVMAACEARKAELAGARNA